MISTNSTLDRAFRHLAWANQEVFAALLKMPESTLGLRLHPDHYSVGQLVEHIAGSSGFYAWRLDGLGEDPQYPAATTHADVAKFKEMLVGFDERLRVEAQKSDEAISYIREGKTVSRMRSTIVIQAIHHATEHRAQIAAILTAHNVTGIDLDELDVWALGDAEGKGE